MPMKTVEDEMLETAIIDTNKEIFGDAWGKENTEALDETGDRSLETLGEGLEGQHEADEDEDSEDETSEEETSAEGDAATQQQAQQAPDKGKDADGKGKPPAAPAQQPKPGEQRQQAQPERQPGVPPGVHRESNERARRAEQERDEYRTKFDSLNNQFNEMKGQFAGLVTMLQRQQQAPQPAAPGLNAQQQTAEPEFPDIFENPKEYANYLLNGVKQTLAQDRKVQREQFVEQSMAAAHTTHGDAFDQAFNAVKSLPMNQESGALVQRICSSPNPGEALVRWHKQNETLRAIGDDPDKWRQDQENALRDKLLQDPEFIAQSIARARQQAETGNNGEPLVDFRPPRSLSTIPGVGTNRAERGRGLGNDQEIFDGAFS